VFRFKTVGRHWLSNLCDILLLSTSPLCQAGEIVSKPAKKQEIMVKHLFIRPNPFLAINIWQKTNNSFPGEFFTEALQLLVHQDNILSTIQFTSSIDIGEM